MQLPLPVYLHILRAASDTDNAYDGVDGREDSPETGHAFAVMTHAIADFVETATAKTADGYDGARSVLEDIVHTFPLPEAADIDPVAAFLTQLGLAPETPDVDYPAKDDSGK
jgi:hypothetical protein